VIAAVLIHGYFGIDDTILFTTVHDEPKVLLPRLERLAGEHSGEGVERRHDFGCTRAASAACSKPATMSSA
jgi:hypothetical protein